MIINLYTAWFEILCGFIFGAIIGLLFDKEEFFGGYNSWSRRLLRLSHISFFGIAIINMFFVFTVHYLNITSDLRIISYLYIIGAITMPLVCFLSAIKKPFRHLFFIPAGSLIIGTFLFILKIMG